MSQETIMILCTIVTLTVLLIWSVLHILKRDGVINKLEEDLSAEKQLVKNKDSEIQILKNSLFREGDPIYINHKDFTFNKPYYIVSFYPSLGGRGAIVLDTPPTEYDKKRSYSETTHGVPLKYASLEKFETCQCCGEKL